MPKGEEDKNRPGRWGKRRQHIREGNNRDREEIIAHPISLWLFGQAVTALLRSSDFIPPRS